jgi:RNA polymerase sigma factor (sigma-70 family)
VEPNGAGDYEAFVRAHLDGLRRLAFARTGSWAGAEDICQDVLADAFRRWSRLSRYDDPLAWARRAVLNRSVSRWRTREREQRALARLGGWRSAPSERGPVFQDPELWSALRRLSPRQFQVAILLWFEELTVAEVARTLGCGEDTVRTHWRRARASLADALDTQYAEPDDASPSVPPIGDRDDSR